jgi:hypothetical protein
MEVRKRLKKKYMCLQDEKERLHAAITKSDSMKKENSKCKENMDMEVAQCRMQLAVEKEKGKCLLGDTHPSPIIFLLKRDSQGVSCVASLKEKYQSIGKTISNCFSLCIGFFFLALYVTIPFSCMGSHIFLGKLF